MVYGRTVESTEIVAVCPCVVEGRMGVTATRVVNVVFGVGKLLSY